MSKRKFDKINKLFYEINIINNNYLWIDKYKPNSIEDIVIFPKKRNEIIEWINNSFNNNLNGKIMILYGPLGCGKVLLFIQSTLIDLYCKKNDINCLEWNDRAIGSSIGRNNLPWDDNNQFKYFLYKIIQIIIITSIYITI